MTLTVPAGTIKAFRPGTITSYGIPWERIGRYAAFIDAASAEFGPPAARIAATIVIESAGDPKAVQKNDRNGWSYGLMQIVPYGVGWNGWNKRIQELTGLPAHLTARIVDALYDPKTNIRVGASILRDFERQYGSWDKASSAFFLGNPDWRGADTVNGNTGAHYRATLNALIEEIEGGTMTDELPYRVALIPRGNPNRPGTAMNAGGPRYVTVHETGNRNARANAEMHRRFTHEGGGPENVSFHVVVDDEVAIQLLPFTEIGFHAGDGCDNRTQDLGCFDSVAIETCVNADGNWERTFRNLAQLIAKLIRENPTLSVDRIRQHNRWSGKNCPQRIRETGRWEELLANVRADLAGTTPEPAPQYAERADIPQPDSPNFAGSWQVEVVADSLPIRQYAHPDATEVAAPLAKGRTFAAVYLTYGADGRAWWVSTAKGRVPVEGTKCPALGIGTGGTVMTDGVRAMVREFAKEAADIAGGLEALAKEGEG